MKHALAIERLVLVIWVGGIWTIGFLVAPTLFAMIDDRTLAGTVAGRFFTAISYVGLLCGALLLTLVWQQRGARVLRHWRSWVIVAMLVLTATGQFLVTPKMHAIRQLELGAKLVDPQLLEQFQLLHGISSGLFVVTSVLGMILVVAGLMSPDADSRR